MSENIQSITKQEARYTITVSYMPDLAAVQSVTILNEGMTSEELGEVVTTLDNEYKPFKFIIINDQKES